MPRPVCLALTTLLYYSKALDSLLRPALSLLKERFAVGAFTTSHELSTSSFSNCIQLDLSESRHVVTLYLLISYPRATSDTGPVRGGLLTYRRKHFRFYGRFI